MRKRDKRMRKDFAMSSIRANVGRVAWMRGGRRLG